MNLGACQYPLIQLICSYYILTSFHQYAPRFSCILDGHQHFNCEIVPSAANCNVKSACSTLTNPLKLLLDILIIK